MRICDELKCDIGDVVTCIPKKTDVQGKNNNADRLNQTEKELTEASTKFQSVVSCYPDNIIKEQEGLNGLFIYDVVDGNAHVVDPNDKSDEMVTRFKNEAVDNFEEYAEAYKEVLNGTLYINYSDGRIEIEPGANFAKKAIECSKIS